MCVYICDTHETYVDTWKSVPCRTYSSWIRIKIYVFELDWKLNDLQNVKMRIRHQIIAVVDRLKSCSHEISIRLFPTYCMFTDCLLSENVFFVWRYKLCEVCNIKCSENRCWSKLTTDSYPPLKCNWRLPGRDLQ